LVLKDGTKIRQVRLKEEPNDEYSYNCTLGSFIWMNESSLGFCQ